MFCVLDILTCILLFSIIFSPYYFIFCNVIKAQTPPRSSVFPITPTKKKGKHMRFFLLPQSNKEKGGACEEFYCHRVTKKKGKHMRFFLLPQSNKEKGGACEEFYCHRVTKTKGKHMKFFLLPQSNKEKG